MFAGCTKSAVSRTPATPVALHAGHPLDFGAGASRGPDTEPRGRLIGGQSSSRGEGRRSRRIAAAGLRMGLVLCRLCSLLGAALLVETRLLDRLAAMLKLFQLASVQRLVLRVALHLHNRKTFTEPDGSAASGS